MATKKRKAVRGGQPANGGQGRETQLASDYNLSTTACQANNLHQQLNQCADLIAHYEAEASFYATLAQRHANNAAAARLTLRQLEQLLEAQR